MIHAGTPEVVHAPQPTAGEYTVENDPPALVAICDEGTSVESVHTDASVPGPVAVTVRLLVSDAFAPPITRKNTPAGESSWLVFSDVPPEVTVGVH